MATRRPAWRLSDASRRHLLATLAERARTGASARGARPRADADAIIAAAIREETAIALGRSGRRLQAAVRALAAEPAPGPAQQRLQAVAAAALWACVVQREAMGLTDHSALSRIYQVPPVLWRLMGAGDAVVPPEGDGVTTVHPPVDGRSDAPR